MTLGRLEPTRRQVVQNGYPINIRPWADRQATQVRPGADLSTTAGRSGAGYFYWLTELNHKIGVPSHYTSLLDS